MEREPYDPKGVHTRFWQIIADQELAWIARCEHLTEQAQRQLEAWGIAEEPLIDF